MSKYEAAWVRQYFDGFAEKEWSRWDVSLQDEVRLHIHKLFLQKHISKGLRVLELGAGSGRFTEQLVSLNCRVTVVDISAVQLQLNKENAARYNFADGIDAWVQADICDLSAIKGPFDACVVYGGPFSYVFDRLDEALSQTRQLLKPGGVMIASVMSVWGIVHDVFPEVMSDLYPKAILSGDLHPTTFPPVRHRCHMFRSPELRQAVESANFTVMEMAASNVLTGTWKTEQLVQTRMNATAWKHLLMLEESACFTTGCVDMGTHLLVAARRPATACL
eukprot:TRINITY_DN11994_c0_g1_i1.p1 TRINITY_DN11994_c0_g1~~TRINITY_DN11994_c0_g1_i1.p1  ORF type:complete len:289 (+),score=52.69 TRINITY_DN11994_c0_g1_i1:37-867(+)